MAAPPRNPNGMVQPHDDPDIAADHHLLRYIDPQYLVPDENVGGMRVSSGAFCESSKPPKGMSVDLEAPMIEAGLRFDSQPPSMAHGVARLRVGSVREKGCQVGSDPIDGNPYHGEVWGVRNNRKKALRDLATILKLPTKR